MSFFTSEEKTVLSHESLEDEVFDFPPEIPAVGQVVKIVHYHSDGCARIVKFESTVITRSSEPDSVTIRVFSLVFGNRIGTQEFREFRWDRISKTWSFYNLNYDKYEPAIIKF